MKLPPLADEVEVADFETELVVVVPSRRRAYHLDERWALLVDSCRRGDDVGDLVEELVSVGGDPDQARRWFIAALEVLRDHGVLSVAAGPV